MTILWCSDITTLLLQDCEMAKFGLRIDPTTGKLERTAGCRGPVRPFYWFPETGAETPARSAVLFGLVWLV